VFYNPFVHAYVVRERIDRLERQAALVRLLSAPRLRRPGEGVDDRPPPPAVTAAAGAGPPQ
jgi:hypothetical protein